MYERTLSVHDLKRADKVGRGKWARQKQLRPREGTKRRRIYDLLMAGELVTPEMVDMRRDQLYDAVRLLSEIYDVECINVYGVGFYLK